jgi:hypothetical protein
LPATGKQDCDTTGFPGAVIPGLVVNGHVDITSPYVCQGMTSIGTDFNLTKYWDGTKLKNGTTYVVGITAYDQMYNLGPLSVLQCQTPQPVNSFFPTYCQEGGNGCVGGCGQCNVGSSTDGIWPALAAMALAAVGISVRHDRRRRRRGMAR